MFVVIGAESNQGKTSTLNKIISKDETNSVFITHKINNNTIVNTLTVDRETGITLHAKMIKYLALGYKTFYIDDLEQFEWDNDVEYNKNQLNICLYELKEISKKYKVDIYVTVQMQPIHRSKL